MKTSIKALAVSAVLIFCFSLCGCNKEKKAPDIDKTLQKCYGKSFTLVSSEENGFGYLDKRTSVLDSSNAETDSPDNSGKSVRTAVYKDENGTEFNVLRYFQSGIPGDWNIYDDYCVQWLLDNTDTLEKLDASPFEYKYFNTIGCRYLGQMFCSFDVTVESYDDIRFAAELAYDIAKDVVLPYSGSGDENSCSSVREELIKGDNIVHSLIPHITFVINSDTRYSLGELRFMTENNRLLTDKEQLIKSMEERYITAINENRIPDALPQ